MHKYIELCTLFEKVEYTQSRTEMSLEVAKFLKKCSSEEVEIISYMVLGRVAPMFVKSEFNYSEKSLINLLSKHTSLNIESLRKESGDIGDTVYHLFKKVGNKSNSLDVFQIYEILWDIVNTSGIGSILKKNNIILNCIKNLDPLESKYFVRTICGDLRLGLSSKTLLEVFSFTVVGDKSLKEILQHSYGVCADIGYIGSRVVKSRGLNLEDIQAFPGTPVLSRLVQRVGSFDELESRFSRKVYVQPKFDGLRCQIHKWSEQELESLGVDQRVWSKYVDEQEVGSNSLFSTDVKGSSRVKLFTRNLEDVTEMFPEIVEYARDLELTSFIMDSEVVGWDYKNDRFLSYQETMQRRRKYSVKSKMEEIPVKAFVFDLMYLKGESLVTNDTQNRIEALQGVLNNTYGGIVLADSKAVSSKGEIVEYFNKSVADGLEGIIVKDLKGGYLPGARNYEWVKVKKSIEKDLVDTIDMVVVGYYKGSGRRADFGIGAILGAIYNEKKGAFDAICKIGTGMSDENLKELNNKLSGNILLKQPKQVRVLDNLKPDIWVTPRYTITVDADEITKNISKGKKVIGGGLSLRFPRLIEFDRDKNIEDITTVKELVEMYKMRKIV